MSKVLERNYQSVSVTPVLTQLELRVHGEVAQGDRLTLLSSREARILAYGLLAEAERLEAALADET